MKIITLLFTALLITMVTFAKKIYLDAMEKDQKAYDELTELEAQNIRKAVRMQISEAEPNDQTKK